MDKKTQSESIEMHKTQINKIISQMDRIQNNHESSYNNFLPIEINQKILNHELSQLKEEKSLHEFCIHCIKQQEHVSLVSDYHFNNAKKKKLLKLAKKNEFPIES